MSAEDLEDGASIDELLDGDDDDDDYNTPVEKPTEVAPVEVAQEASADGPVEAPKDASVDQKPSEAEEPLEAEVEQLKTEEPEDLKDELFPLEDDIRAEDNDIEDDEEREEEEEEKEKAKEVVSFPPLPEEKMNIFMSSELDAAVREGATDKMLHVEPNNALEGR